MYKVTLSDGRTVTVKTQSAVKAIVRQFVVFSVRNSKGINISYKFGI